MNNHFFKKDNINDLYKDIIKTILYEPDYIVSPRGMKINEIISPKIVLTNPLNCLITIPERKMSYTFAIIEKFEYLYGKHDPIRLVAYNKQFENYNNKFGRFDGAYSDRFNYWYEYIYGLLKSDKDTRQAVITIYGLQDRHESKDIPCTLNHQYFIRDNKLHLIAEMRSNDMLWGFPYDINGFVFMQEVLASWLGIEVGTYTHIVGSMHIYTDDEKRLDQLINSLNSKTTNNIVNPRFNLTYEETKQYLPIFIAAEEAIRNGNIQIAKQLESQLPLCLFEYYEIIKEKWLKQN